MLATPQPLKSKMASFMRKKVKRTKNGSKKPGHFFLYLPANGGKQWIDQVKRIAAKTGYSSVSKFIRDAVDSYMESLTRK